MEYLELGDLQKYLTAAFPEGEARTITQQVLEGIAFMHDSQFAHRDLKPGVSFQSSDLSWHRANNDIRIFLFCTRAPLGG